MNVSSAVSLAALLFWVQNGHGADNRITAAEFAAKALPVLPIEEPHDFRKAIENWTEPLRRDPAAKPSPSEMALSAEGWRLLLAAHAGPVLHQAAEDFRDYLARAMQVRVTLATGPALEGWQAMTRTIIAGTGDEIPGCGAELRGRKDYQIIAAPDRIAVCGFDERGALAAGLKSGASRRPNIVLILADDMGVSDISC